MNGLEDLSEIASHGSCLRGDEIVFAAVLGSVFAALAIAAWWLRSYVEWRASRERLGRLGEKRAAVQPPRPQRALIAVAAVAGLGLGAVIGAQYGLVEALLGALCTALVGATCGASHAEMMRLG